MSVYSNIDRETFQWVRSEVEVTIERARDGLQQHVAADDKEGLYELTNHLHQVVGSLQMLELKSLSTLIMESELLVEDYSSADSEIGKSSFVVLLDSAFKALAKSLALIEQGVPERPIEVVELINQIRAVRGLDDIEISALFSPMIEVFPEINSLKALKDKEYIQRATALRKLYQSYLLHWLKGERADVVSNIRLVFEKLSQMSTFGSVSRIWWVATAYTDYIEHNELQNKSVHGRILRELGDHLRSLQVQGESALVRDPGEELIKIMLFYIAMSSTQTEKITEIVQAFSLREYFPSMEVGADGVDIGQVRAQLHKLTEQVGAPIVRMRQSLTQYFETETADNEQLDEIIEQMQSIAEITTEHEVEVVGGVVSECLEMVKGLRNGTVEHADETALHLASALMYVDDSVSQPEDFDATALSNGQQQLLRLRALNNQEELTSDMGESTLTSKDRQALLDVVAAEVADSIKEIENKVESFSEDYSKTELLSGIDATIRQVKGAIQVLGEQKLGLFLQLVEEQFTQIENSEVEPNAALIEALAISIGVTEEYVKGLQAGRTNMDYLLDRGHSDLEVAVGKKVSRADVEDLLDESSDTLFSWLANQADLELFTNLKLNLRDLSTLARKTGLHDLEQVIKEQDRLVDVISQEPAYLTDNITNNLQNNMANITEQLIQLYGTEDTPEEIAKEAEKAYKRSAIEDNSDDKGQQFHDEMDLSELADDIDFEQYEEDANLTEIGKQNAVDGEQPVDDVIFEAFIEESGEILDAANELFQDCSKDHNDREAIRDLRRSFHTLKGSSRMVGLTKIGEIAWFSESLFNYVLDTEKPLTNSILGFARESLDTIAEHYKDEYANQADIDVDDWGAKTEAVVLDEELETDDDEAPEELIVNDDKKGSSNDNLDSPEPEDSPEQEESFSLSGNLELADIAEEKKPLSNSEELEAALAADDLDFATDEIILLDDDIESASFLVIEDAEMREVFAQEAQSNLARMNEQLMIEPLIIKEDDVLSISVHTLLGNARTMGLDEIATAYDKAERLCIARQIIATELEADERAALSDLAAVTHKCLANTQDTAPYYVYDQNEWEKLSDGLQTILDQTRPVEDETDIAVNEESEETIDELQIDLPDLLLGVEDAESSEPEEISLSTPLDSEEDSNADEILLDKEQVDDFDIEIESFAEIDLSEDIDLAKEIDDAIEETAGIELSEELLDLSQPDKHDLADLDDVEESDSAVSDRVATAFDNLDLTDDLLDLSDEKADIKAESTAGDDDLAEFEQSLETFNDEKIQANDADSDSLNDSSMTVEDDIDESIEIPEQESLIPDELVDLLEDDALELQWTPESAQSDESPDEQKGDAGEPETDADEEQEDLVLETDNVDETEEDAELREIFIEELRSLHHELDVDVANLVELQEVPAAMANVMRYLHTIKGSSLMANATILGSLTHDIETYLENGFIRDDDDLRRIRQTLESYIDAVDLAANSYQQNKPFVVPQELLSRLGVDSEEEEKEDEKIEVVHESDADESESTLSDIEQDETPSDEVYLEQAETDSEAAAEKLETEKQQLTEQIAALVAEQSKVDKNWKSARGWNKNKPKVLAVFSELGELATNNDDFAPLKPLINDVSAYADNLTLSKVAEFKASKALFGDVFTFLIDHAERVIEGQGLQDGIEVPSELQALLTPQQEDNEQSSEAAVEPETKKQTAQETTSSKTDNKPQVEPLFVPGSDQVELENIADLERQAKAARERAAALRIDTETLDSLTNYVGDASMNRSQMREDVLSIKSVVEELYNNVQSFGNQLRELEIEADTRISSRTNEPESNQRGDEFDPLELDRYTKIQQLSRGLTESLDDLSGIQTTLSGFINKTETALQKQDRLNRELQDEIMQVRLVSFGGVGPQLRQVVRRTARELGKEVDLELLGSNVRMDKTILDGIVPALEHMLRNAVDHGIELAEVRKEKKKSKVGKVTVECRQVAREIIISIRDDGAGLDLEAIRKKAIDDNLLAPDQPLNPADMLMYISQSGFSTASSLTQISGRGVGMDVVQSALHRMSGSISYDIENTQGGSHFSIQLPISLAVSSAMFVQCGGEQFAIAARTIERVINIDANQLIQLLKAEKPTIEAGGQNYALIDLAEYLGYQSTIALAETKLSVVLVDAGVQNVAVIVDQLDDTQEIVVKSLGSHLGQIPIYSGATIRANGQVVLLLDLIGISYYESLVSVPELAADLGTSDMQLPNIMVVDDSLTVRKSAERDITALGITVTLVKDGLDAQVELRQEKPDMILLDIEMPRMDGFELLEWVKSEDDLKDIPVVMISSRATDKYVNKATELGCSAFLGKPYLLENLVSVFNQFLTLDAPIDLDRNKQQ